MLRFSGYLPASDEFKHLNLGSRSIEVLGMRNEKPQRAKALAGYIRRSGVQLVLQEIGGDDDAPRTTKVLDAAFARINENDGTEWR